MKTESSYQENAFLAGDNIYLRALKESDAEAEGDYPNWLNSEEVCAGNSHHTFVNTKKSTLDYIASVSNSANHLVLAIVENTSDRHVGNISLQNINFISRSAEFAILIGHQKSWGKGYGKEAGLLMLKHGFNHLNLHRIHCGTFENNLGMQKLAESLGLKQVGRQREAAYKNGVYLDILQYDILKAEFLENNTSSLLIGERT